MIFVTLGTHERPFYRLVKQVERLIQQDKIKERVVIQLGFTDYYVKGAECYRFVPEENLKKYIKKCSLMITHGGLGSIMRGIENGKPVVAVARKSIFNEHTDDHQSQIVQEVKKRSGIIPVYDIKDLESAIKTAKKLKIRKRKYKPVKILNLINGVLKNIDKL